MVMPMQDFALAAKSVKTYRFGQAGIWSTLCPGRCQASATGTWQPSQKGAKCPGDVCSAPTVAERRYLEKLSYAQLADSVTGKA